MVRWGEGLGKMVVMQDRMAQLPSNWIKSPAALFSKNFMADRLAKSVFRGLLVLIINRYYQAAGPDKSVPERTKTQQSWEFGNCDDKKDRNSIYGCDVHSLVHNN